MPDRAVKRTLSAAVDVGGTFVDVVVADALSGETRIAKVLHRRGEQGADILDAIGTLARRFGAEIADVDTIVIGTTVVANALLQGKLARTGLITTEGFRDVLEIARMHRASSYDLHKRRPPVVVPRELRLEVSERIDYNGAVLKPLNEADVTAAVDTLKREAVEAVAVSLLFSFVRPEHEQRIAAALAPLGVPVSLSSEVLPVFREYERTMTTAINAATSPVMRDFLDGLEPLIAHGVSRTYIMGSAGGCLTFLEARRFPVKCAVSGPAGGVMAARELARRHGIDTVLTLDVGGTSSDVAMLRGGQVPFTNERAIGGYPLAAPSVEIETVGAGGGSVAIIDRAGLLKVGPQSAGSTPGPVCYGRGGVEPTVTDAHVGLNRLGAHSMLRGSFTLDRDAAIKAIEEKIAAPLGLTWQKAALGILQITTANIVAAVRTMSVERGHDPRVATLVAFGGAGPLHAIEVARALEIPRVLVPLYPGVFSACGILSADIQYAAQRTWFRPLAKITHRDLDDVFSAMLQELMARIARDGLGTEALRVDWAVDLRYRGQSHCLMVPLAETSLPGLAGARTAFLGQHLQRYGHASQTDEVDLVNIHLTVSQVRHPIEQPVQSAAGAPRPIAVRDLWLDPECTTRVPIYDRADLRPGWAAAGPLIIEQYDSALVLSPADSIEVLGDTGALMITVTNTR